jgi:thymidylate kinase/RimJ/RimL family protein N-acetyltransferase
MINTKLILVDGITGSGKSTTAHFIARQLEKNGIKARWYNELEIGNPLHVKNENNVCEELLNEIQRNFINQFETFLNTEDNKDTVFIFESFLFQDIIALFIGNNSQFYEIEKFYISYLNFLSKYNPAIIYLYQSDAAVALKKVWSYRGYAQQKESYIKQTETKFYKFCQTKHLCGESAVFAFWQDIIDTSEKLYNKIIFNKIKINTSDQNWEKYREQYCSFLNINFYDENPHQIKSDEYCGFYKVFEIYLKENILNINWFWPDLKLLPKGKDEFEIESFPISLTFQRDTDKKIIGVKINRDACLSFQDLEFSKINHVQIQNSNLLRLCGEYYDEANNLNRRIYLKNCKLFYWRSENNESQLIPISDTQFIMKIPVENSLDFKLVDGKWQFTFDVKGEEPSSSLFVPKAIYTSTRIIKDQFLDKDWREYFEYRTKCAELMNTELHFKTWEELKEESLRYLERGHGIYITRNNGDEAGYFFLAKMQKDKPHYKYVSISHYFVGKIIDDDLLKLIVREYLEYHHDHGFLLISSINGVHDYLLDKLNGEVSSNAIEYELTKKNLKREVLENWIKMYSTKFPNLTMKFYERIPDELIDEYCRIYAELFIDLPVNSNIYEPDFYAQNIKNELRRNNKDNHTSYSYLIFNEKNQLIAMTNIKIDVNKPQLMQQQLTGVIKEYRRIGLAKWLKSAMYLKLEEDFPEMVKIITSCHPDNHGSKAVNLQMGYIQTGTSKEFIVTREKAEAFIKVYVNK